MGCDLRLSIDLIPQKYFLQVNLVKATYVDELVKRLKKGKYRSKDEILQTSECDNHFNDNVLTLRQCGGKQVLKTTMISLLALRK